MKFSKIAIKEFIKNRNLVTALMVANDRNEATIKRWLKESNETLLSINNIPIIEKNSGIKSSKFLTD